MSLARVRPFALLAMLLAGCGTAGKAAPPPAAPAGGAEESPEGTADEEMEMKKTESEGGAQPTPGYSGGFAQPPEGSLGEAESLLERDSKDLARALSSAKDCEVARKALGSMRRSANRICDLNGPGDPGERCAKARDRVDAASENVRRGCGS